MTMSGLPWTKEILSCFAGVDSVTNSFADELFGHLAFEFGMDKLRMVTSFTNINQSSARFIRSVMDRRTMPAA